MEQNFYVRIRGKVMGPFPVSQLRSLRDRGQLQSFHEVSVDRLRWSPATTIIELFPLASVQINNQTEKNSGAALSSGFHSLPSDPLIGQSLGSSGSSQLSGMMEGWYVADDLGNRQGPIDATTFKIMIDSGQVNLETMLWRHGMTDWISAEKALPKYFRLKDEANPDPKKKKIKNTANSVDDLRKTRLGILLLVISGAVGMICFPIGPVAFVLALIGVGFCMSAPPPARSAATLTFYFALGTGILVAVWFVTSMFSWDLVAMYAKATYSGSLFRVSNTEKTSLEKVLLEAAEQSFIGIDRPSDRVLREKALLLAQGKDLQRMFNARERALVERALLEGTLFKGQQAMDFVDVEFSEKAASLTILIVIALFFLLATALFFLSGAFLQHTLKKLALVSGDVAIIKLANLNFTVYCVLSGMFVVLIYLFVLIPVLFVSGIAIISPLVIPKTISLILLVESILFLSVSVCLVITLIVMMQLYGRYGKLIEDVEGV